LVEPEFSIKPYLKDMERGDCCVIHRMNCAYSEAVSAANRAHLEACHGLPLTQDAPTEASQP
jgi:hypothetical protein